MASCGCERCCGIEFILWGGGQERRTLCQTGSQQAADGNTSTRCQPCAYCHFIHEGNIHFPPTSSRLHSVIWIQMFLFYTVNLFFFLLVISPKQSGNYRRKHEPHFKVLFQFWFSFSQNSEIKVTILNHAQNFKVWILKLLENQKNSPSLVFKCFCFLFV